MEDKPMNKLAAGLALSALATAGADAQEAKSAARVAPPAVYAVAPGLGDYTDEVLFGEVWKRPQLAPRDRSLITVAALVAMGRTAQVGSHMRRALENGVTPAELGEAVTQMAFYGGWPTAISAVGEAAPLFEAQGIAPLENSDAPRIALEPAAEAARAEAVATNVAPTAPALAELTDRVLFGDLWQRPDLSARDRSLVTMAALIAIGQAEQLPFHANRAMDNGLTQEQASEVVTHLAFYAGWPRAMSAVPVLTKVFAARDAAAQPPAPPADLRLLRGKDDAGAAGPEEYFTGEVRITTRYSGDDPARIGGATVSFSPGARTAWHTHPLGQTLYVVSGHGWVQKQGGPVEDMYPGDVVWIPPHVRHWHGASASEAMTHFAVAEALDGSAVTWLEKVSDADYRAGSAR